MTKPIIRFSHQYPKLPEGIKSAVLLAVQETTKEHLPEDFLAYDTMYHDADKRQYYPLPEGQVLVLVFWGGALFTTIRRWTSEKARYYRSLVGEEFEVVIDENVV